MNSQHSCIIAIGCKQIIRTRKEKCNCLINITIKARQCAEGRKQRQFMLKEDLMSPNEMTESTFITSLINAKENGSFFVCREWPGCHHVYERKIG